MVLSVMVALITCPALLGTTEAIRQGQRSEKREEHRARRCNLVATCITSSKRSWEIDNRPVVLRKGKVGSNLHYSTAILLTAASSTSIRE